MKPLRAIRGRRKDDLDQRPEEEEEEEEEEGKIEAESSLE